MYHYKAMKVNGKRVDEHRKVMREHLGRELLRKEVVHHKDGNKRNNNIGNLQLMTLSQHTKLHFPNGPDFDFMSHTSTTESRMGWTKEKTLILIAMLSVGSKKTPISRYLNVGLDFIKKVENKTSWVFRYYKIKV